MRIDVEKLVSDLSLDVRKLSGGKDVLAADGHSLGDLEGERPRINVNTEIEESRNLYTCSPSAPHGSNLVVADGPGLPRHTLRLGALVYWHLFKRAVDADGVKNGSRRSQRKPRGGSRRSW